MGHKTDQLLSFLSRRVPSQHLAIRFSPSPEKIDTCSGIVRRRLKIWADLLKAGGYCAWDVGEGGRGRRAALPPYVTFPPVSTRPFSTCSPLRWRGGDVTATVSCRKRSTREARRFLELRTVKVNVGVTPLRGVNVSQVCELAQLRPWAELRQIWGLIPLNPGMPRCPGPAAVAPNHKHSFLCFYFGCWCDVGGVGAVFPFFISLLSLVFCWGSTRTPSWRPREPWRKLFLIEQQFKGLLHVLDP